MNTGGSLPDLSTADAAKTGRPGPMVRTTRRLYRLTARASAAPLDVHRLPRTTHHALQAPIYEMEAVLKTTLHGASGEECTTAVLPGRPEREAGTRRLQLLAVQTDTSCSQTEGKETQATRWAAEFSLFILRPPPCNFQRENTKQETDLVSNTCTVCWSRKHYW